MNKNIFNKSVQDYITKNLSTDVFKVILKKQIFPKVTNKEIAEQISAKAKSKKKLPTYFKTPNIYFPNKVNIEQTSSEKTAEFKSKIVTGNTMIDATGGFGVDSMYFSKGFKKTKLETDLYSNLLNFYREHKDDFIDEFVAGDFIKSELKGTPSTLFDLSTELRSSIHETLQEPLENWSQIQLEPTFVYGIREYKEGAILVPHRDRDETHIVSAIINIDKEVSEDWPLVIEDHNQKKHEVFLDPGEILFYESAKLLHGRPYPLKGKRYANIFCHYKPLNLKSQT